MPFLHIIHSINFAPMCGTVFSAFVVYEGHIFCLSICRVISKLHASTDGGLVDGRRNLRFSPPIFLRSGVK